jgi:hypothetical protein
MIPTTAAPPTPTCEPSQRVRETGPDSTSAPRVATSSERAAPTAVDAYAAAITARNTV